jgi:hypothetical protein
LTLEQVSGGRLQTFSDVGDALRQGVDIDFYVVLLDTHPGEALGHRERTTGGNHRLGGHTIEKMRSSTNDVALDDRDVSAETSSGAGCRITGRTTTDDHKSLRHDVKRYR